jgi:hypothetical protein
MMKRLLLSSTALVAGGLMAAPAMAADPIKIGVGGYYTFFAVAGQTESVYALDGSSTQYKALRFYQEGEIHFDGQTKLDNGTSVGVHVELEGWSQNVPVSAAAQGTNARYIDEAYLYSFGDWGRIEFGSRDQATYRMYYGAPSAFNSFAAPGGMFQHNSNATIGSTAMLNNAAMSATSFFTIGGQYQDVNRINYFTPRFYGLQIGAGYAPKINVGAFNGPGTNTGGVCGFTDATAQINCPTNDFSYQDLFDIGANYLNKFGDITVALFGAFNYATYVAGNTLGGGSLITGANATNWKQWVVGMQFGWNGFTVGGSYGYDNQGLGSNWYTGVDNDNRKWAVGLMYETGPWQVSFAYGHVTNNNGNGSAEFAAITPGTNAAVTAAAASTNNAFGTNPNAGALKFGTLNGDKFEFASTYALGPGVKAAGSFQYYNASGPAASVAGQAWGIILGMALTF